eukprot:COSAG02_NODE_957_length_15660_cov_23.265793_8_plen_42_part_00
MLLCYMQQFIFAHIVCAMPLTHFAHAGLVDARCIRAVCLFF